MRGRYLVFVFAATLSVTPVATCYCQEIDDNNIRSEVGTYEVLRSAEGTVTSIDGMGGTFSIRPFEVMDVKKDQLIFQVLPDADVYKAGDKITSSDIQVGDVVVVEYYRDSQGLRAKTINVQ